MFFRLNNFILYYTPIAMIHPRYYRQIGVRVCGNVKSIVRISCVYYSLPELVDVVSLMMHSKDGF